MTPRRAVRAAAVLALAGAGAAGCAGGRSHADAPSARPSASASGGGTGFHAVRSVADVPAPVRLRIPRLGVDAHVERLGLLADGTVDVPHRWHDVGWYSGGVRPGDPGPAVLLGHVDSTAGPAVFYRLPELRRGDLVDVVRADGSVVRFRVTRIAEYAKSRFPTTRIYLPTLQPELRLVTCGGRFDYSIGHYVDNVVAFAVPATPFTVPGSSAPPP
jgi:hypothetical protein